MHGAHKTRRQVRSTTGNLEFETMCRRCNEVLRQQVEVERERVICLCLGIQGHIEVHEVRVDVRDVTHDRA